MLRTRCAHWHFFSCTAFAEANAYGIRFHVYSLHTTSAAQIFLIGNCVDGINNLPFVPGLATCPYECRQFDLGDEHGECCTWVLDIVHFTRVIVVYIPSEAFDFGWHIFRTTANDFSIWSSVIPLMAIKSKSIKSIITWRIKYLRPTINQRQPQLESTHNRWSYTFSFANRFSHKKIKLCVFDGRELWYETVSIRHIYIKWRRFSPTDQKQFTYNTLLIGSTSFLSIYFIWTINYIWNFATQ